MQNKPGRKSKPWLALITIPVSLIIYFLALYGAIYIDGNIIPDPNALGHPFPALTIITFFGVGAIALIAIIISIIVFIVGLIKNAKLKKLENNDN